MNKSDFKQNFVVSYNTLKYKMSKEIHWVMPMYLRDNIYYKVTPEPLWFSAGRIIKICVINKVSKIK